MQLHTFVESTFQNVFYYIWIIQNQLFYFSMANELFSFTTGTSPTSFRFCSGSSCIMYSVLVFCRCRFFQLTRYLLNIFLENSTKKYKHCRSLSIGNPTTSMNIMLNNGAMYVENIEKIKSKRRSVARIGRNVIEKNP